MERCFVCSAQFVNPAAAEMHWAMTGHLLGDPDVVSTWSEHVANTPVLTAASPAIAIPHLELRSAA
jgi:hypothetical protein